MEARPEGGYIPEVGAIPVDEVPALGVRGDVVPAAEHGRQHGVLVPAQRGQSGGEKHPPHVQGDNLWELQKQAARQEGASCPLQVTKGTAPKRLLHLSLG